MRSTKALTMIAKQHKLVADFLAKKLTKVTRHEQLYLWFRGLDFLEFAYMSSNGGRKVFFVIPEVAAFVRQFDENELQYAALAEGDRDEMEYWYEFLQDFAKGFSMLVDSLYSELHSLGLRYRISLQFGNMLAEELLKVITVLQGADYKVVDLVIYEMIEALCARRYKVAYKAYEKRAKQLLKEDFIDIVAMRSLLTSYLGVCKDFKPQYQLKMIKVFGAHLHKLVQDRQTLKLFEALCV